jgi:dihydroneopterin aldolase
MDTIFIREFRVDAWVGIYEWEKQRAQTLEMEIEISPSAGSSCSRRSPSMSAR